MNEPCRHCGSRLHHSITCHQIGQDKGLPQPTPGQETRDRADRVRGHLLQLGELLKRHDNHSGARAAEVLASVPQNDAMLFLERLFNGE